MENFWDEGIDVRELRLSLYPHLDIPPPTVSLQTMTNNSLLSEYSVESSFEQDCVYPQMIIHPPSSGEHSSKDLLLHDTPRPDASLNEMHGTNSWTSCGFLEMQWGEPVLELSKVDNLLAKETKPSSQIGTILDSISPFNQSIAVGFPTSIVPLPALCESSERKPPLRPRNRRYEPRRICAHEGCSNQSRASNLCKRHGKKKICTIKGCTKMVQSQGLCISHGGGRRCKHCYKAAQSHGLCKAHGGGRSCDTPGCLKKAHLRRLCRACGGGYKCVVAGCPKWAQTRKKCIFHANRAAEADMEKVKMEAPRDHCVPKDV